MIVLFFVLKETVFLGHWFLLAQRMFNWMDLKAKIFHDLN